MMKILRIIGYSTLAIFLLIGFSGCKKKATTTPSEGTGVISLWAPEEKDLWRDAVNEFSSDNGKIAFEYKQISFDSLYETKSLNAITAGEGPDVWAVPMDWVYRHKEKLAPLPSDMQKDFNIDAYVNSVKSKVYIDEKVYGLPSYGEPLLTIYNSKLVRKSLEDISKNNAAKKQEADTFLKSGMPMTWEKLTELATLLTNKIGTNISLSGLAIGTDKIVHAQDILYLLIQQKGGQMISDDLRLATFYLASNNESGRFFPGKEALDFYAGFSNPASVNYTWNDSLGDNITAFCNEKAAIMLGYNSTLKTIKEQCPNIQAKTYFAPQFQDQDQTIDYAKYIVYVVPKLSPDLRAAWAFIKNISKNPIDGFAINKVKDADLSLKDRTNDKIEARTLNSAKTFIKGRYPEEFDQSILRAIQDRVSGVQDSQAALNTAANEISEKLKVAEW